LRNDSDEASARLTEPDAAAPPADGDEADGDEAAGDEAGGALELLEELLQAAAVSEIHAIASSAAIRAGFPGIILRT
jgi:hypothetical protein